MSREYRRKKVVIWPVYLDSTVPRSRGRRLPQSLAIPNPSVEEIVKAASELGLNPIVEESSYPKAWWKYRERIIIDKKASKTELLKKIALKIKELRRRKQ